MRFSNLLLLAVLVTSLSNAFAWSVKGNVRSCVQVTVVDSTHRATTSDAQGNFEINSSTTLLPQAGKGVEALQYRLEGNSLTIFHPRDGMMTLSLSTASGKQVWSRPVMIENGLARTQLPDHILNKPLFLSLRDPVGKRQFLRREIALVSLLPSYPRLRFQKAKRSVLVEQTHSDHLADNIRRKHAAMHKEQQTISLGASFVPLKEKAALRLAVSATTNYPPGLIPPCGLHAPQLGPEPVNSYRDPRWIAGSDSAWVVGSIAIGSFNLMVWEDGTARLGTTNGQWETSLPHFRPRLCIRKRWLYRKN